MIVRFVQSLTVPIILLVSCSSIPPQAHLQVAETSAQTAVRIAKAELSRRGFGLPPKYNVDVKDTFDFFEFKKERRMKRDRPIYVVVFRGTGRGATSEHLFQVSIDKESGRVSDFLDMRSLITIPQ
jgi:hypothetical protein